MRLSRFCLFVCLAVASAVAAAAPERLLVGFDGEPTHAQKLELSKYGVVIGREPRSGFSIVEVRANRINNVIGMLRREKDVKFVDLESCTVPNPASLQSVDAHIRFLKAIAGEEEKGLRNERDRETKAPGLDYWEAYRYYIQYRVDENGDVRPDKLRDAMAHRDHMVAARLSDNPELMSGYWSFVGPKNLDVPYNTYYGVRPLSGRINAIAYHPTNASIIYVATMGGVWKTADAGVTWTALTDKMPYLQASSIAIDPKNANNIYVGTGDFQGLGPYTNGVMKSTDGGATWATYGLTMFPYSAISKIRVDPTNSSIITITTGRGANTGNGAIFQSTNAGLTWVKRTVPAADWCGLDISAADSAGKRVYWAVGSSTAGTGAAYVYKSVNSGATWTAVTTPIPLQRRRNLDVACSKISSGTVYVLAPNSIAPGSSTNYIYKTTNGGTSWANTLNGTFPNGLSGSTYYNWSQDYYDYYIGTSTATVAGVKKDAVYVGLITVAMSPNGGTNWYDVAQTYNQSGAALAHNDQHSFAVSPTDPNTVMLGSDGGVFKMVFNTTTNKGTFTSLNKAIGITQHYKIAVSATNAAYILGGAQDQATPGANGDLSNWINPGAGDGGFCAIDPTDNNIQYNSTQGLSIYRTTDHWTGHPNTTEDIAFNQATQETYFQDLGEPTSFVPPFALGKTPTTLYAGTNTLWKWTAVGGWVPDLGAKELNPGGLNLIVTCPSDANRIYTDSGNVGQLWMTTNAGTTFTEIGTGSTTSNSLPQLPVTAICPAPANASDIIVGLSRYGLLFEGVGHLWQCTNPTAAATSRVWKSISGTGSTGLPDVPVNTVVRDPYSPTSIFYVGTDVGVFMTKDSGLHWTNMTAPLKLPNVQVNDLKIGGNGYLYAGTFGRGIWKIKLVNPASVLMSKVTMPASIKGGLSDQVYVWLKTTAPYGGSAVSLTSNNAHLTVPATITVPNGATNYHKLFTTTAVSVNTVVTVTAKLGSSTVSTTITLTP